MFFYKRNNIFYIMGPLLLLAWDFEILENGLVCGISG
jgi:hypothetical protein